LDLTTRRHREIISDTGHGRSEKQCQGERNRQQEFGNNHHYRVTVTYRDNEISGRVYNNRNKVEKFAARQKKSPVVKTTRIEQIN